MSNIVLFHHAQGLTTGVHAFADRLRDAGHQVEVPDLYDGLTFPTLETGVDHAEALGFREVIARGVAAGEQVTATDVVAGFSMGNLPTQQLAQTTPGVRACILYHGAIPLTNFSETWPAGVALQIHVCEDDPWGDVDDAKELAAEVGGELFLYPGSDHLVTDSSLAVYDEHITDKILERTLALLARLDG